MALIEQPDIHIPKFLGRIKQKFGLGLKYLFKRRLVWCHDEKANKICIMHSRNLYYKRDIINILTHEYIHSLFFQMHGKRTSHRWNIVDSCFDKYLPISSWRESDD